MKRTIYTTVMVSMATLLLAGLAMGSGMDAKDAGTSAVEGHMGATTHEMAAQPLNAAQISELQRLLNGQGYNVGEPNGIIGSSTTEAIRQFQTHNQLTSSGTPDPETLRRLSPDAEKQEFFGLAPEYGEQEGMMEEAPKKLDY